ncbi:MAG: GAF domain-containing protein [Elusimicrobiales bacterium]
MPVEKTGYDKLILDALSEGVYGMDMNGNVVFVNKAAERILGYDAAGLIGKHSHECFHYARPDGSKYDPKDCNIYATSHDGKVRRIDTEAFWKKDGTAVPVEYVATPVTENGTITGVVVSFNDLTARLLAEEKTREYLQTSAITNHILKLSLENKPLSEILQNTLDEILSVKWLSIETKGAIFLADEKTRCLKMAAKAGLGEFILKTCAEVPAGRCLCGKALLSGKPVFKAHLDGEHENSYPGIPDHGHYIIPITAGGRVYGVLNVYTGHGHARSAYDINFLSGIADILAGVIYRRKLNERLALLRDLRLKALEARDISAALKLLTDNICEITGWAAGEVWLPGLDKLHLSRSYYYGKNERRLETFASRSKNFTFKKGEGLPGAVWQKLEPVWFREMPKSGNLPRKKMAMTAGLRSGVGIPIIANGEFIAAITFLSTEVKIGDEELVNFLGEAAGQLGMIFHQNLLAEQLVQTQKMDTVGKLAGGIAHDFNNILGAILGYTGFLIRDLKNMPSQLSDALEVKKAAERAAALTKQLLAFSRKKPAVQRIIDLNGTIKGLALMLGKIIGENIKLEIVPEAGVPLVKIDPTHLEQIVINLVVNARDAIAGSGVITIKTGQKRFAEGAAPAGLKAGTYAMLTVSDTGSGMSEEIKKKIFEPFFTTKPPGKGTGMGLAIVYGVIKQNNAQITVDSVPDEGSTFTVYIPASSCDGQADAEAGHRAEDARLRGSETILIAEDDEAFRPVLVRVLKEHGYNALAAAGAAGALELAEQHAGEIHLLLTDIRMPGKSGAELAGEMLKLRPGIKLLYMTGHIDIDVEIQEKHHITDDALFYKPIEYPRLLARIREVLNK